MADPDSRPSEKKIAALLLIAVVAAGIGLWSYSKESPEAGSFIGLITDRFSLSGFSIYPKGSGTALEIEGELSFDAPPAINLGIQSPADETTLILSGKNTLTLDRTAWQFPGKTAISLVNFTGKAVLGNTTSVSGSARTVSIDSASRSSSEKGIPVQATGLALTVADFSGVSQVSLELKNITGTVKANDGKNSAVYTVSNNRLSISGFIGDIQFFGDRIVLRGKGKLNAELLKNAK